MDQLTQTVCVSVGGDKNIRKLRTKGDSTSWKYKQNFDV
jgi:hypothetical protein